MGFDPQFARHLIRVAQLADVRRILKDLGVNYQEKKHGDLWHRCVYPGHKERKGSAHICANPLQPYHSRWHCFGCGRKGSIFQFVQYVRGVHFQHAVAFVEARIRDEQVLDWLGEEAFEPSVKPFYNPSDLPEEYEFYEEREKWNPPYIEYLEDRGIPFEQATYHNIGYCDEGKYSRRIVVPVRMGGELRNWVARSIINHKSKVLTPDGGKVGLFGSELAQPALGPVILFEGWADALHGERLGFANCMSLQTDRLLQEQFDFIRHFDYAIVVPDPDYGGSVLVDSLSAYVEDFAFLVGQLPGPHDPAKASDEELETAIDTASAWQPSVPEYRVEFGD
jgi:DNA primase